MRKTVDVRVSREGWSYQFEPLTQGADDFLVARFPLARHWGPSIRDREAVGARVPSYPEAYRLVGLLRAAGLVVCELPGPGQVLSTLAELEGS